MKDDEDILIFLRGLLHGIFHNLVDRRRALLRPGREEQKRERYQEGAFHGKPFCKAKHSDYGSLDRVATDCTDER